MVGFLLIVHPDIGCSRKIVIIDSLLVCRTAYGIYSFSYIQIAIAQQLLRQSVVKCEGPHWISKRLLDWQGQGARIANRQAKDKLKRIKQAFQNCQQLQIGRAIDTQTYFENTLSADFKLNLFATGSM